MLSRARPLRIGLLSSRRTPGLSELLSEHRRGAVEIVCAFTSEEEHGDRALLAGYGVPLVAQSIRRFYARHRRPLGDLSLRRRYDRRTASLLARHHPDLLLLSSYLYLLTEPLLDAYPNRIVNVHGSDLARTGPDGRPLYPGLHAVREAIYSGETETRATAHIVTPRLDEGPILVRSSSFPVSPMAGDLRRRGAEHALNAYAFAHQEWMLATAWGPLLTESIALLGQGHATGRLAEIDGSDEESARATGARP